MTGETELDCGLCRVRSWRIGDETSLERNANNRNIWRNLRDAFPHPYTLEAARDWISFATTVTPDVAFAVEVDGEACGGIGLRLQADVDRVSAEIGFWLGEPYWNRGIMSAALAHFVPHCFRTFELTSIFARCFAWNHGSMRILEKNRFCKVGVLRQAAVKDGELVDVVILATTSDEWCRVNL